MGSDTTVPSPLSRVRSPDLLFVSAAAAAVIGCILRAMHGNASLWFDETFTAAIAAEPSLRAVVEQILQDVNAPLYYLIEHYWSLLFGLSDQSLRFPSLAFATIAPFLCLIPAPGIPRRASLIWCGLTAVWIPGLVYAQEARCYSLLYCLAIAMTLAHLWLIEQPTTKRAAVWACCAAAAIATHYYALILVGLQGLVYLYFCGRAHWRTWPAATIFLPVFAWLAIHAQRIASFADPHVAWYSLLTWMRLISVLVYIAGSFPLLLMLLMLGAFAGLSARRWESRPAAAANEGRSRAWVAPATAAIGVVLLLALGFWRPSFADRYLFVFMPGILLGVGLLFACLQRSWRLAPVFLLAVFIAGALLASRQGPPGWKSYEFETASRRLIAAGTKKLVFLWDNPTNLFENPAQLQSVGGFFFRREGVDVAVTAVKVPAGEDPNRVLLSAADTPDSGIIWLYDASVHHTAAVTYPPKMTQLDPTWFCRDFGFRAIGIIACSKNLL